MKKVLLFGAVLAAVSFTSCKKSYTCTWEDGTKTTYEDPSSLEKTAYKSGCEVSGGTWTED